MNDPSMTRRLDAPGVAAVVTCCLLWGGNAVAAKFAIPDLPPVGGAGIRFLLALPVIALICRRAGQTCRVGRSLWWLLGVHGLLTAIQIGSFNWGTSRSEAGRSSVFINIHPLIVAPLAWALLGERLGIRGLMGFAAAVVGVLILLAGRLFRGGSGGLEGDLVVLGSGVVFGIQTIAQKKTFPLIPPLTLLFAQSALAMLLAFLYSAVFEGPGQYHFTRGAVCGVLYQGLAVSGACFALWILLLRRHPAGQLVALSFLTPLFGVALGHLLRGEALTWPIVLGGALVGLGIFLVASDRATRQAEPDLALPGEDAP
jgi:drug/metabolite transporter (DMT)-like permease